MKNSKYHLHIVEMVAYTKKMTETENVIGTGSSQRRYPITIRGVPIPGKDNHLQQKRLGGGIPKHAQSSDAVGHDSKDTGKDGSNGAVLGSNIQGSGAVGAIMWQQELGGDREDSQGPDGVPSSGGATDTRDYGKA